MFSRRLMRNKKLNFLKLKLARKSFFFSNEKISTTLKCTKKNIFIYLQSMSTTNFFKIIHIFLKVKKTCLA